MMPQTSIVLADMQIWQQIHALYGNFSMVAVVQERVRASAEPYVITHECNIS